MCSSRRLPPGQPRGFTLLEVLLALSLSAIILLIVGGSMRLHARMVSHQRLGLERAELARAILRQMARDLESAVSPTLSGAGATAADSTSSADASGEIEGTEAGESGGNGAAGDGDGTDQADSAGSPSEPEVAEAGETIDPDQQQAIGLYGSSSDMRWETTRATDFMALNRAHDATINLDGSLPRSDLQTVAYYLGDPAAVRGSSDPLTAILRRDQDLVRSNLAAPSGPSAAAALMRLHMDYAAHSYLVENGGAATARTGAAVLADEIDYLEFAYFDGIQWLPQWDSTAEGGLPVAVRITIRLRPPVEAAATATRWPSLTDPSQGSDDTFALIVRLPVGQISTDQQQEY